MQPNANCERRTRSKYNKNLNKTDYNEFLWHYSLSMNIHSNDFSICGVE